MEVTYQLEREDYWQYYQFVAGRTQAFKRQMLLRSLIPAIIILDLILLLLFLHVGGIVWVTLGGAAVYILCFAPVKWSRKRIFLSTVEARPGALGLHTLALGVEGFHEENAAVETRVRWPKVSEIADNKQLIVLFLGPQFGYLIPKRAFPSEEQAQAFLETARAYHQSALKGTAPMLPEVTPSWPPAPQRLND